MFVRSLAFCVLLLIPAHEFIHQYRWMDKVIKQEQRMDYLLIDFRDASFLCGGRVKAGEKYLFGKNVGAIVGYEEISQIYLKKVSNRIPSYELEIKTRDGKTETLAIRIRRRAHFEDLIMLFMMINNRNPEVLFGYPGKRVDVISRSNR